METVTSLQLSAVSKILRVEEFFMHELSDEQALHSPGGQEHVDFVCSHGQAEQSELADIDELYPVHNKKLRVATVSCFFIAIPFLRSVV